MLDVSILHPLFSVWSSSATLTFRSLCTGRTWVFPIVDRAPRRRVIVFHSCFPTRYCYTVVDWFSDAFYNTLIKKSLNKLNILLSNSLWIIPLGYGSTPIPALLLRSIVQFCENSVVMSHLLYAMDTLQNEKLHLKIFDGDDFYVWKFQTETMYAAKKLLRLVNGKELWPILPTGQVPSADDIKQQEIWDDKDATTKYLLWCGLSTGKLTTCQDTNAMWKKLNVLHLKKTEKNVFNLQANFYDYKMSKTDNISSHVQTITNMVVILVDLKHPLT